MTRSILLFILGVSLNNLVNAQSFTVVNHTDCFLSYAITGTVGKPCSSTYSKTKSSAFEIAPGQTAVWTSPQKVWGEANMPIYWSSFMASSPKSEKKYVGYCVGISPRSTTANVRIPECVKSIYYSWQQDSTKNVYISIEYGY